MTEPLAWLTLAFGATLVFIAWRRRQGRLRVMDQLNASDLSESIADQTKSLDAVAAEPRLGWIPFVVAASSLVTLLWLVHLPTSFAFTLALIFGIIAIVVVGSLKERRRILLERQLADAIDLLVASLRAGAGVLDALNDATRESRRPLRPILQIMLLRLRIGNSPQQVYSDLADSVPLESFRVFAMSQSVHWEVGGSVASSLANVGRFIRDRIDVRRNIATQTSQAKTSAVAVTLVAYFIALVVWRSRPDEMAGFLATTAGRTLVPGALILQAFGLLWMFRLTRIKY